MQLPETWMELSEDDRRRFTQELRNEVCETHVLADVDVVAVARRERRDDFLFIASGEDPRCFVVHLTWQKETSPDWPSVEEFNSLDDFRANWEQIFE